MAAPACIHAKLGRFWYNVICRRKYYFVMYVIIGAYLRMENRKLNFIGIGERSGSGVPDIVSVWKKHGLGEIYRKELYAPDRTIMSLPFKQAIKRNKR